MCIKGLINSGIRLLFPILLTFTVLTVAHAQPDLGRADVSSTGQWLDARKASFTGAPIFLHLRTGHERALLMPEPVQLSDANHQSPGYDADIDGDVVRFYPLMDFSRESIHLTGLVTNTEYVLRVRASAFGIRQPLQILVTD